MNTMKLILPPIIGLLFTMACDKAIDLVFNLGPYDDSAAPGIVFLIEAILLFSLTATGFLFHWLMVYRIDQSGKKPYLKAIGWGLLLILSMSLLYLYIVTTDLNYPFMTKIVDALRLFLTLAIFLFVDIYSYKLIKKYAS